MVAFPMPPVRKLTEAEPESINRIRLSYAYDFAPLAPQLFPGIVGRERRSLSKFLDEPEFPFATLDMVERGGVGSLDISGFYANINLERIHYRGRAERGAAPDATTDPAAALAAEVAALTDLVAISLVIQSIPTTAPPRGRGHIPGGGGRFTRFRHPGRPGSYGHRRRRGSRHSRGRRQRRGVALECDHQSSRDPQRDRGGRDHRAGPGLAGRRNAARRHTSAPVPQADSRPEAGDLRGFPARGAQHHRCADPLFPGGSPAGWHTRQLMVLLFRKEII